MVAMDRGGWKKEGGEGLKMRKGYSEGEERGGGEREREGRGGRENRRGHTTEPPARPGDVHSIRKIPQRSPAITINKRRGGEEGRGGDEGKGRREGRSAYTYNSPIEPSK